MMRILRRFAKTLSDCAGRGLRVLVLAEADGCVTETDAPAVTRVIGLCLLTDEIRPAAQETLHYFHTQGVALKIISGDDEKDSRGDRPQGRLVGRRGGCLHLIGRRTPRCLRALRRIRARDPDAEKRRWSRRSRRKGITLP